MCSTDKFDGPDVLGMVIGEYKLNSWNWELGTEEAEIVWNFSFWILFIFACLLNKIFLVFSLSGHSVMHGAKHIGYGTNGAS